MVLNITLSSECLYIIPFGFEINLFIISVLSVYGLILMHSTLVSLVSVFKCTL